MAGASLVALTAFLTLLGFGVFGDASSTAVLAPSIGLAVVFLAAFSAFVVLFSGFSQASAIAMKGMASSPGRWTARRSFVKCRPGSGHRGYEHDVTGEQSAAGGAAPVGRAACSSSRWSDCQS